MRLLLLLFPVFLSAPALAEPAPECAAAKDCAPGRQCVASTCQPATHACICTHAKVGPVPLHFCSAWHREPTTTDPLAQPPTPFSKTRAHYALTCAAKKPFGGRCTTDTQCESGQCFPAKGGKAGVCTQACPCPGKAHCVTLAMGDGVPLCFPDAWLDE